MSQASHCSGASHGSRVLNLTTRTVGPIAAAMLGAVGADVIKTGPLAGDLMRRIRSRVASDIGAFSLGSNRNKRSIALDLIDRAAASPAIPRC